MPKSPILKIAKNDPNRSEIGKKILGTKKWNFSRKAHFSDQKTRKTFKKMKNLKNCQNDPNRSKIGWNQFWALKMTLFEKIFFAHFSDQETRKTFKKMKNLKNCQKWPKKNFEKCVQKLGKPNFGH